MPEIEVYPGRIELAEGGAAYLVSLAHQGLEHHGQFNLALAGGSTPEQLYSLLARPPYLMKVDWQKVHVFWGDERCVPPDNELSNYRLAAKALLEHVPLPEENVHRIHGELPPEQAATAYERVLREHFGQVALPRFDLVLLGLGEDGHTASLFPGSQALEEKEHWTAAVAHHQPPAPLVDRVSFTLPVLNAAAVILVLVSGEAKAGILAQVLNETEKVNPLPAQRIQPEHGRLIWMVDQAAYFKE